MTAIYKPRRHVIYVAPTAEVGGGEKVLATLAVHAAEYDYSAQMVFMRPGPMVDELKASGIATSVFREHRYRNIPAVLEGRKFLRTFDRRYPGALFHVNHTAHLYSSWAAEREIWHLYDKPGKEIMSWILRCFPASNAILASPSLGTVRRFFRIKRAKEILPCIGINDVWQNIPLDDAILSRCKLEHGRFLLTMGRIQKHKGLHVLIHAMARVLVSKPYLKLCIVGKASSIDEKKYATALHELASELGIASNVVFTGFVSDCEVKALMQSALFMVHPALSEGFGLVLLQAMSESLPVLATNAEGPCSIVANEQTGLLVEKGDASALSQQILRLAQDGALRRFLSDNAKREVNRFSEYEFLKTTFSFYDEIINRNVARF